MEEEEKVKKRRERGERRSECKVLGREKEWEMGGKNRDYAKEDREGKEGEEDKNYQQTQSHIRYICAVTHTHTHTYHCQ